MLTPEWPGWFITRNAIVDAEVNGTPQNPPRNYYLMLQYCRVFFVRNGDRPEIARWQRLLKATSRACRRALGSIPCAA